MTQAALTPLLHEIQQIHENTPDLTGFGPWPSDLTYAHRAPVSAPVVALLPGRLTTLAAAAPYLEWRRTYRADEVGDDFLNRYGYVELFGPQGHFHSTQLRGYIAYWDRRLDYGWHHHEAEELYFGLEGTPEFLSQSKPSVTLHPGQTRHHAPWEVHSMKTHDTGFLCYALWRGPGLAGLPEMT